MCATALGLLANCGKVGYQSVKFQTIASTSVFGNRPSNGSEPTDGTRPPGGEGTDPSNPNPNPNPGTPTPNPNPSYPNPNPSYPNPNPSYPNPNPSYPNPNPSYPYPNPNPSYPNPNPSYPNPNPSYPNPNPSYPNPNPSTPNPTPSYPNPTPTGPTTPTSPTSPSSPTPTSPVPTPQPPAPQPTPPPIQVIVPPTQLPVDLICSVDMTSAAGYNLLTADSSTMVYSFFNAAGARVCDFSVLGAREDILNTSVITIPQLLDMCPGLSTGGYTLQMHVNALAGSILMSIQPWNPTRWTGYPVQVAVTVGGDRSVSLSTPDMPLSGPGFNGYFSPSAFGTRGAKVVVSSNLYERCSYSGSPLVVQLHDPGPIVLTPPLEGIDFDLFGTNTKPPHAPSRISWFTAESAARNYFIVLPDERGEVHGIDQLFGDNTNGPDGLTPAKDEDEKLRNGYEALRKWDGRRENGSYLTELRDGFITPKDPVFDRLRLWRDVNHDGVAQSDELSTLAAKQVVSIDLDYARDFVETDGYGNSTRMKSVAKTADGKLHLMYDLWFRALDPSLVPKPLVAAAKAPSTARAIASVPSSGPRVAQVPYPPAPTAAPHLWWTVLAFLILALTLIFVP